MVRLPVSACLALFALAFSAERVEPVYREGAELSFEQKDSMTMEMDEASMTVNGVELPPEVLEESGMAMPSMRNETTLRYRDRVLEVAEGRPKRVRREFETVRERKVEDEEESEQTGPLEGRAIVIEGDDGEVTAELEGDGEEIEDVFLEAHRLVHDVELLLPDSEVELGDTWQPDEEAWREFIGIAAGPVLFEDDAEEEDLMEKLLDENATVTGEVELAEIEERDGLRCAVLAFTYSMQAEVDDPGVFGMPPEEVEDASGKVAIEMRCKGRLWYALEEGRPVAMEQDMEGSMNIAFEAGMTVEGNAMQMKVAMSGTVEGEMSCAWSVPKKDR